ncbi:unnamed protein product [Darwinula stevensoni]|uniref:Leucine-rich repeat-containing protein 59 n=1 Tax=Darwinula stevensoni TaxID=69355 RepID=A0A7R9A4I1_9CRUS|nr:unnamed protein product [Darwinula stevensoni]CAG0884324.1 unnamed protein product [Darwinula stevensoni]
MPPKLNVEELRKKVEDDSLDLSLLQLEEIPVKEIAQLKKVTKIDLSNNNISSLPPSLCSSWSHIVRLDLSKNKLEELPTNIGHLKNLQVLDLYCNKIQDLPVSFCHLRKLKWLDLKNNPLRPHLLQVAGDCLDEKACQHCAHDIVAYMQKINSERERDRQLKLRHEREEAAARQAEKQALEEAERKKRKEQKMQAKARRKAELESLLQEEKMLQQQQEMNHGELPQKDVSYKPPEVTKRPRRNICIRFFMWLIFTAIKLALFTGFIYAGFLLYYMDGDYSQEGLFKGHLHLKQNTTKLVRYLRHTWHTIDWNEVWDRAQKQARLAAVTLGQWSSIAWTHAKRYSSILQERAAEAFDRLWILLTQLKENIVHKWMKESSS